MQITKTQIKQVRELAYAELGRRQEQAAAGKPFTYIINGEEVAAPMKHAELFVKGFAKVDGLSLTLQYVNAGKRKALRDIYKFNGKVVAKADILKIAEE